MPIDFEQGQSDVRDRRYGRERLLQPPCFPSHLCNPGEVELCSFHLDYVLDSANTLALQA